jgi:hypothetical protein
MWISFGIPEQQKILRLQKPTPCFGKGISIRSSLFFFITSEILIESEIKHQKKKKMRLFLSTSIARK